MLQLRPAIIASATLVLTATAPAWAGETTTQSSMMIAAIGRDVDAISGGKHTNASIVSAVPAEMPVIEALENISGQSEILVKLDANGKLSSASVNTSSGHRRFDESALRAVRSSTFTPERVDGHPVAGSYLVEVTFDPAP